VLTIAQNIGSTFVSATSGDLQRFLAAQLAAGPTAKFKALLDQVNAVGTQVRAWAVETNPGAIDGMRYGPGASPAEQFPRPGEQIYYWVDKALAAVTYAGPAFPGENKTKLAAWQASLLSLRQACNTYLGLLNQGQG
jgi:hypothetical protein